MTNINSSDLLETATRAAMLAGEVIQKKLGSISKSDIDVKQASDFVTKVDRESEELIINTIRRNFPDHNFLAEESLKESGRHLWIIDPLDGTTNFIHQYPVFSVSIALKFEGEVILGVVYDPMRQELFTAEKGNGAFLNGNPFKISPITDLAESLIATGFPFRKKEIIDDYLKLFRNIFDQVSDIRRAGSAAIDLAYVACGRCDGFFEIGLSPWDIAAGSILIKEAGGIITDFSGGDEHLITGNVVAAAAKLHGKLLKEIKDVFSETISR